MGELVLGKHRLSTPAVCGCVVGKNFEAMRAGVARALKMGADLVELRVDGMRNKVGWEKLLQKNLPTILTNRPKREGGGFNGGETERVKLLSKGIERGVSCVDIELSTPLKLRDQIVREAKESGVTVIMSYHNFSKTPPTKSLITTIAKMEKAGCDIAKVVTFAKNSRDAFNILDLQIQVSRKKTPVVSFAMGDVGKITRLVAPVIGSPLFYASTGKKTAPGQLEIKTIKNLLREMILERV